MPSKFWTHDIIRPGFCKVNASTKSLVSPARSGFRPAPAAPSTRSTARGTSRDPRTSPAAPPLPAGPAKTFARGSRSTREKASLPRAVPVPSASSPAPQALLLRPGSRGQRHHHPGEENQLVDGHALLPRVDGLVADTQHRGGDSLGVENVGV